MTNTFLKINKDFFKLGLNPTELLLLAQIDEFNRTTGDCFMSDEAFAESFGVSQSTISRELKVLEKQGFIVRNTVNVKGGKQRHIHINLNKIEEELTNVNLKVEELQTSNCLLTNVKLTVDNKQNDLIKDNIKEKEKDNIGIVSACAEPIHTEAPEAKEEGSFENPILVNKEWLMARHNELAVCKNNIFKYVDHKFYKAI